MMGADSVAYHRETVMARADDHPGQALAYYGSRGETPLRWGGGGAAALGLRGAVTDVEYEAVFGPGGARDPESGVRLARTRRPGMELVISAHKSVAELGVVGRAEDMHRIMDAERDATLEYLDAVTRERGGRRGRAQTPTPTAGLVYAHTRHATSRAGDPCPHDHVLVVNVVEMFDERGGHKAADTVLWRDHLHAATVMGRMAAARVAVELGYAIEADHGRSGRLGHWRIAGVPDEVLEVHSKRAAEIAAAVAERGTDTYRARQIAARDTRGVKRHASVTELLPRWRAELAEVGWPAPELLRSIESAAAGMTPPRALDLWEPAELAKKLLEDDGPLARRKVFTASDVVVAVGPGLYGQPLEDLHRAARAVLRSPDAVPLVAVAGARDRAYAPAVVIAAEQAIARAVAVGAAAGDVARLPDRLLAQAVARTEAALGRPLTPGQRDAVTGICTQGRQVSLVLGVAGAGKTTALACVTDAYTAAGFTVVGTATSGQAARTLGREAGMAESRTLASLLWRLDHGRLRLTDRHVVILDEAGMTDDPYLLRVLVAAQVARAKVVLVGDDRQLGSVGPGGALGALLDRHGAVAHMLDENVRQVDRGERRALAQLRAGNVARAVSWYAAHDRIAVSANRDTSLQATVDAWVADALTDRDTAMYAWRRANVTELNARARARWAAAGRLTGPQLEAPGGRHYAAGDRIVALAPGADGNLVTSERGTVTGVIPAAGVLMARMDDGRVQRFEPDDTAAERLDHAYAVTVHRSQGATVDVAHRFEDGGGRELTYVALSRARHHTTIHVVADHLDQAVEDLRREWSRERRPRWAIDTGTPAARPEPGRGAAPMRALRRRQLERERNARHRAIPPDPTTERRELEALLAKLQRERADLLSGQGRWTDTPIGAAARALDEVRRRRAHVEAATATGLGWKARRERRRAGAVPVARDEAAFTAFDTAVAPVLRQLDAHIDDVRIRVRDLDGVSRARVRWLEQHSDVAPRLQHLDGQLEALNVAARLEGAPAHGVPESARRSAAAAHDVGIDHGL